MTDMDTSTHLYWTWSELPKQCEIDKQRCEGQPNVEDWGQSVGAYIFELAGSTTKRTREFPRTAEPGQKFLEASSCLCSCFLWIMDSTSRSRLLRQ